MQQIQSISPILVNKAVFNIAKRYGVIKDNSILQAYIDSHHSYSFVSKINEMQNLTKTIEDSGGTSVATNAEYFKLLHQFVIELALVKRMSTDAIYEVIFTEVRTIQAQAKMQQEQAQETVSFWLQAIAIVCAIAIVIILGNAGINAFRQRFVNAEEVERLSAENERLQQENNQLKTVAEKFDTFKKERQQIDNLKDEIETLRQKNSDLNDRIIECKKPFWERNCR